MALPSIQALMRPVLETHQEGQVLKVGDVISRLVPVFEITEAEQAERQPSGDVTLVQRVNWARENLVKMGLLERPSHGETRVTAKGLETAASDGAIAVPSADWAAKPVSRESVLAAIALFDRDGRDQTLRRHGFRRALDYVVVHEGSDYDAKALYGIAYGIEYPEEEPIRTRGLSGGIEVNRKLEELGFEVVSRRSTSASHDVSDVSTAGRVWLIRAGREGRYEDLALAEGVCLIGWSELGEIPLEMTRDELKNRISEAWNEHRPQSLASQAGQIYRFVHEVREGDLVVLPLKSRSGLVAVGRITGGYVYRADGRFENTDAQNTRAVDWLAPQLSYERFDPDLREAFGQQGTLSEISKPNAAQRIIDVVGGADASFTAPAARRRSSPGVAKRAFSGLRRDVWRYVTQAATTEDDGRPRRRCPYADARCTCSLPRTAALHPQRSGGPAAGADAPPDTTTDDHHRDRGRGQF